MKKYFPFLFLFLPGVLIAQVRNLNYYIEQAVINSPLINKNKNESILAELDLKQVKAILSKPEINLEGNVMFAPIISRDNNSSHFEWVSNGAATYTGYDLASTDGGQYQAFVSVKKPVFNASVFQTYSERVSISRQQNENQIALTTHEIEQLVSYQYILCLRIYLQAKNSSELVKEVDSQLQILRKLVENGLYKQTDLMLLQIELQNYRIETSGFLADYKSSIFDLNLICGINDTSYFEIPDINLHLKDELPAVSQFLTSYKLDSLNIISEQGINEIKYKPQVNLFANAGLNAVYIPSLNRLGFSTGINFSWTVFDGNQKEIQKEKAKVNILTLEFDKENFQTQNEINKNKILNKLSSLELSLTLIEAQLNQYYKLIEAFTMELSQGEISMMDLKSLIKDIASKKQALSQLRMEEQSLINSYNYWNY